MQVFPSGRLLTVIARLPVREAVAISFLFCHCKPAKGGRGNLNSLKNVLTFKNEIATPERQRRSGSQ
jgi:hypothetical protein